MIVSPALRLAAHKSMAKIHYMQIISVEVKMQNFSVEDPEGLLGREGIIQI